MRIVNQAVQVLKPDSPMRHIEKIGRVCYKSEGKIGKDTDKRFVQMLYGNRHFAMLEHYRFIMKIQSSVYNYLKNANPRHFEMTDENNNYMISFNARALIELVENCDRCKNDTLLRLIITGIREELIGHIIKRYDCYELFGWSRDKGIMLSSSIEFVSNREDAMSPYEWTRHGWLSAHFITDRGISHELVRHREETSFAQESTRYCNYGSDRFDDIIVIDQGFEDGYVRDQWIVACETACDCYSRMINNAHENQTPQMVRSVLPTCLKTEIVVTAPMYEWNHIFDLRYFGFTGKPHPKMVELMDILYKKVYERD